jgi:hypothetical protein
MPREAHLADSLESNPTNVSGVDHDSGHDYFTSLVGPDLQSLMKDRQPLSRRQRDLVKQQVEDKECSILSHFYKPAQTTSSSGHAPAGVRVTFREPYTEEMSVPQRELAGQASTNSKSDAISDGASQVIDGAQVKVHVSDVKEGEGVSRLKRRQIVDDRMLQSSETARGSAGCRAARRPAEPWPRSSPDLAASSTNTHSLAFEFKGDEVEDASRRAESPVSPEIPLTADEALEGTKHRHVVADPMLQDAFLFEETPKSGTPKETKFGAGRRRDQPQEGLRRRGRECLSESQEESK